MERVWSLVADYIVVIVAALVWLGRLIQEARRRRAEAGRGAPGPASSGGEAEGQEPRGLARLDDIRHKLWALSAHTASLRERAKQAPPSVAVLAAAIELLGEEQRELIGLVDGVSERFRAGDIAVLGELDERLSWETLRVRAVEHMLAVRLSPELGPHMADADTLASALAEPLVEFARAQNLSLPEKQVVCVPRDAGGEAIWFGLLPRGYPTVFVPENFSADLLRWPALAHEMGHLMWREVPGLGEELRRKTGLTNASFLLPPGDSFDLRGCYSSWLEELFCDTVAAVQLGPPALRGMVHIFSAEGGPAASRPWVIAAANQRYLQHPPPGLRVMLTAHVLRCQGFSGEIERILASWRRGAGDCPGFTLPIVGGGATILVEESVVTPGRKLVELFTSEELESLQGFPLPSIPGFSLTPGLWGRVERARDALLAGGAPAEAPRVLIAAAVEASVRLPGIERQLAERVARAIIGRGEPERGLRSALAAFELGASVGTPAASWRDAVVLREVLRRPRGLSSPSRRAAGRL